MASRSGVELYSSIRDCKNERLAVSRLEPRNIATSQHRNIATSQHRNIATSQHRNIAMSQHRNVAMSQCRNVAMSDHLTTRPRGCAKAAPLEYGAIYALRTRLCGVRPPELFVRIATTSVATAVKWWSAIVQVRAIDGSVSCVLFGVVRCPLCVVRGLYCWVQRMPCLQTTTLVHLPFASVRGTSACVRPVCCPAPGSPSPRLSFVYI